MKATFDHIKHINFQHINKYGEVPLPDSPVISLNDSQEQNIIPQQYLTFYRTKSIIESILSEISFSDDYLLFVNAFEEESLETVYIQVGIIGQENYPPSLTKRDPKIVYGRRWLVEPDMPTSEVIQTALLAIQKVREHELREYFTLVLPEDSEYSGKRCTPFNSHLDLPLIARNEKYLLGDSQKIEAEQTKDKIKYLLSRVMVAGYSFKLLNIATRDISNKQQTILDIELIENENVSHISAHFSEFKDQVITLALYKLSDSDILFALMDHVINLSKNYVEEQFKFENFARFSKCLDIQKIGELSCKTRLINKQHNTEKFKNNFKEMTFYVDSNKVPPFNFGRLGKQQKENISRHKNLKGFLPA